MKKIELSKHGKNKGKYFAMVDNDIFDIVNQYDWSYSNGYAKQSKLRTYLHIYIWTLKFGEIPADKEIEHWDENGLNCQISNLRLATSSENRCNVSKRKNNTSGVRGVSKEVNKKECQDGIHIHEYWRARIAKDKRKKTKKEYSKTFPYTDEGLQQAKNWIKQKSLELHKEFSIYNKDDKDK